MMHFHLLASLAIAVTAVRAGLESAKNSRNLGANNFHAAIAQAEKGALVAFYAPWCGHCKTLAPAWDEVAGDFANEQGCMVAHVDADKAENKGLASTFSVTGFPTIKFFPGGGQPPQDYSSGRSADAIRSFLNTKCGTDRQPGGSLGSTAGRIPSLDALAAQYLGTPTSERPALLASASALARSLSDTSAAYYLKVFSKLTDSTDYVQQELDRLGKIASKRSGIAGSKLDELQLRQNILAAFNVVKASASSLSDEAVKTVNNAMGGGGGAASSVTEQAGQAASDAAQIVQQMAGDAQANINSAAGVAGEGAAQATDSAAQAAAQATEAVRSAIKRAGAEL